MNHAAKITLSKQYYSESFEQASRYGSRKLMIARLIGFLALIVAMVVVVRGSNSALAIALFAVAGASLLGNPIQKAFWLRNLQKGKRIDETVDFVFEDSGIQISGPFSNGSMAWDGIERQLRTPKGLLLWPQKGMYFYLPDSMVDQATIEYVQSKVA